jgi:RNA polymerase sigma factor (sigma-70 family)
VSQQIDEASLIKRVGLADPEAVKEFYNTYIDRIYSSVFNQVGRDHDVTQEIVQDIFLAAVKAAKNFKGNSKLYTWISSITHKKVVDYYRSKNRIRQIQYDASVDIESIEDKMITNVDPTMTTNDIQIVRQALDSLPIHYKQALMLKYIDEMSVEEIGITMNRTAKSIEGLLSRAKKTLKEYLVKNGVRDIDSLRRLSI